MPLASLAAKNQWIRWSWRWLWKFGVSGPTKETDNHQGRFGQRLINQEALQSHCYRMHSLLAPMTSPPGDLELI
jgi:hypothetical protein